MYTRLLALLTAAALATACADESPNPTTLPPPTQTGSKTLAALVNSQPWISQTDNWGGVQADFSSTGTLDIYAKRHHLNDYNEDIQITVMGVKGPGRYELRAVNYGGDSLIPSVVFANRLSRCFSTSGQASAGFLEVTYHDPARRILAGRFELQLAGSCGAIRVTKGQFDLLYTAY